MPEQSQDVVKDFLHSDVFVESNGFDTFFNKDLKVYWHASSGYKCFDYNDYRRLSQSTSASYTAMRNDITHLFSEGHRVAARFTVYVKTIENPGEEVVVGYFLSLFEIENNKISTIHQSSHPAAIL